MNPGMGWGGRAGGARGRAPECRWTAWSLLAWTLVAGWTAAAAYAGEMEGPLTRSPGRDGKSWPEDHRLDRVVFDNDGEWFRMIIPIGAPWAHWTLTDPPRIVVDLGQTVSLLPEAPGLYQARLDRGAVRAVRTAQHSYSDLDHRVRITLELSQVVPYQARRVGEEIQILVPDRAQRTPRRLVLGTGGLAASDRPETPPSPAPDPMAIVPSARATDEPAASPSAPAASPSAPAATTGREPLTSGSLDGRDRAAAAPTLREALLALGVTEAEEITPGSEAARTLGSMPPSPRVMQPASTASTTPNRSTAAATPAKSTASTTPAKASRPVSTPSRTTPAAAAPHASGSADPEEETGGADQEMGDEPARSTSSPARPNLPVVQGWTVVPPGTTSAEGAGPDAPASDPRERGASRLLKQAAGQFTKGQEATAASTARRAHSFYAGTPSGDQAGLLAREILYLLDRTDDAMAVVVPGVAVDTTRLGRDVFRRLLDRAQAKGDAASFERLLEEWAPRYGAVEGLSGVHYQAGESLLRAGAWAEARERLRLVPAHDSLASRAALLIALSHEREGDKESAITAYRQVDSLGAGTAAGARARARIADLEFQLGRVREALAGYERMLQASPPRDEEAWGLYQTGNCHYLLGDREAARARYQRLAERWPDSFWTPFARERLEELSWRDQRAGQASNR